MNARVQDRWAEINEVLDRVLDLPPAARPEFLQAIRSDDPWLEAEIERLIAAIVSSENFLHDSAPSYAAPLIRRLFEPDGFDAGTRFGTYEIISELGRGGTATVYLAHDQKHQRRVAIKVPRVELATALGPERFLREIQIAAQLQHPAILPLHDSGEAEGVLYYVMPYVEGESLRQRLNREGHLSIEDALHIVRHVADALVYAHAHGVVHRDIKPENILLSEGHALVADFGIARAITIAGGERLQETGPLGTAAYMSPEQGAADPKIDGRSDIYSLGCVVYEILGGRAPFAGTSPQEILARHSNDPVPSLRTVLPGAPQHMEQAISRALAKRPADRFSSAADFLSELERGASPPPVAAAHRRRRRLIGIAVAGAAMAIGAVAAVLTRPGAKSEALDEKSVTLLPFRPSGGDSSLAIVARTITDLVAGALAQAGGMRPVEPATLLALHPAGASATRWTNSEAETAAKTLGAGRIVRGNVELASGRVTASAELVETSSGAVLARADANGTRDSMDLLARQLAGILLARSIHEPESRIPHLLVARPAALHWYLEGRKDYKSGHPDQALDHLIMALREDSTFADAALAAGKAGDASNLVWASRGPRLAWIFRDRLSEVDRAYLQARLGPRYPEESPLIEQLRMWEKLIDSFQDRPDAEFRYETLYQFADLMFHNGAQMDVENSMTRARTAFTQAKQLDSTFTGSTEHLRDISFYQGDTASLRSMVEYRIKRPMAKEDRWISRWMLAVAVGDSVTVRQLMPAPRPVGLGIFIMTQLRGLELDAAERVARDWVDSAPTEQGRLAAALQLAGLVLNEGRPSAARAILNETAGANPVYQRIYHAIYWDGDTASAREEAQRLARDQAVGTLRVGDSTWDEGRCALEMWRLFNNQLNTATKTVRELRAAPPGLSPDAALQARNCAFLLEQWSLIARGGTRGQTALETFDRWMQSVPPGWRQVYCANLLLVRWWEERGELRRALTAARRRAAHRLPGIQCLSSFLREEGRLALAVGDTAGAAAAWRHYLGLRPHPEEPLRLERDRIASTVAGLERR